MELFKVLAELRWLIAIFLLPISFFYDLFWYAFSKYTLWKGSSPGKHKQKVEYVQKQVKDWKIHGKGKKMCTARPQWMSISQQKMNYKSSSYQVEVNLMDIIHVDTKNRVARVEPMVNMTRLLQALIPKGWVVPIVPEIGDLTVGGLVMGGGIETTSHKYGLWQHICLGYEIVVADGRVLTCTKEENSDLYWAIPWSYGTFGFLTAVDLMIIPYKPYIKIVYQPTYSLQEMKNLFEREADREGDNDSVEGLMFSKDKAVIMTGTFVDDYEPGNLNRIGLWYKPWFFTHVQKFLETGRGIEYIPSLDFYFRHNRPYFWLSHIWVPFGNHPIFRFLFGWTMPYNYGLLKIIKEKLLGVSDGDNVIVQDFGYSCKRLIKAIEFFHDKIGIYPLWLCPTIPHSTGPVKSHKDTDQRVHVDIGIYGVCEKPNFDRTRILQELEQFTLDNNGYQGLYAETNLTYEQFNEMFDGSHYLKVRSELPMTEEAFPEVYDKISKKGRS